MTPDLAIIPREQTCAYSIVSNMRALEDSGCLGAMLAWALIIAALAISFFTIVGLYPFMVLANEWGAQTCAEQLNPQLQEKAQLEQQLQQANEQNTKASSELESAQKELQTARTEASKVATLQAEIEQAKKTQTSLVATNTRMAGKVQDLAKENEALLQTGTPAAELVIQLRKKANELALAHLLLNVENMLPPDFKKSGVDNPESLAKLIQEQAANLKRVEDDLHHTECQLKSAQNRYQEAAAENERLKLQLQATKLKPAQS